MTLYTTLFARRAAAAKTFFLVLAVLFCAAIASAADGPAPLPQDTGTAGLKEELLRLHTTARLMHTDAHPDDEDGGMLVLESRGKGVDALLLTLNRGEGGQNKIGSNLFDVLGIVRTLELLAADRYYDVHQRFTHVADFGFSKTADETFQKWQGHDPALSDMVRVIRTFRPDVIVSRFQGTPRDGHGHHQAAGILTREAFRAAADPNRFPDQIKEGLQPWQAKKLYVDNVRSPFSTRAPAPDEYTLALDTGAFDPMLGMSYVQFAMQGLKHQLSQGAGSWTIQPGPHISYYKLVYSVLPMPAPGVHETSFFDGIDTSIVGLVSRLGGEEKKVPFLRTALERMQAAVDQATTAANSNPKFAAHGLLNGLRISDGLIDRIQASSLTPAARADLLTDIRTKQSQFMKAANLALGLSLQATVDAPPSVREGFMAVPGEVFTATVNLREPATKKLKILAMQMDVPAGWGAQRISPIGGQGGDISAQFRLMVPPNAPYTRPCEHRPNAEATLYTVDNPACAVLPVPRPPVYAVARYTLASGESGRIEAPVEVRFIQDTNIESLRPLAVGPKFSVSVSPSSVVVPTGKPSPVQLTVDVRSNLPRRASAQLQLRLPNGWSYQPQHVKAAFAQPGENRSFNFTLQPPSTLNEERAKAQAVAIANGKDYAEGYTLVTRPDLASALYYQPATEQISAVNVKVPAGLHVGYIMGAGDDIPTVLEQIGMNVTMISPQELAAGDLSRYGTIVLGIRAYDTRGDVRANNKRLLDYVSKGGTLLVQYNAAIADFNSGQFTPYPAELSHDRITVEEAPVNVLVPDNPVFHFPNRITKDDFAGWIQERGLYFMSSWDPRFQPLLASHDPGEQPLKGGMVEAHYGNGIYIYTGYAFFRQLPAGVPGAVRLFVNLVSAGHELSETQ